MSVATSVTLSIRCLARRLAGVGLVFVLGLPAALLDAQVISSSNDEFAGLIFDVSVLDPALAQDPAALTPDGSGTVVAESSTGPAREELQRLSTLQGAIDEALAADGLYSPLLRERYQQLAALQQELGQHESAISTLEQAVHIARVNAGLFTLEQIPDIERIIANLQVLSDSEREADYRAYLYYLQQRAYAPGDPRLLAARLAWADWNLQQYQRSAMLDPASVRLPGGERAEELVAVRDARTGEIRFMPRRNLMGGPLMNSSLADPTRYAMTPEMVVDTRLREAQDIYEELLADTGAALTPEQRAQVKQQLISAEYTLKYHIDRLAGEFDANTPFLATSTMSRTSPAMLRRGFNDSRLLLEEDIKALEAATPTDPEALALAYLRQADLHIAYDRRREADEWYAKAWSSLLQSGLDAASAAARLVPLPLVPVPEFAVHPYSRALFGFGPDDTLPYRGYIDVSLNLTRDGDVRGARINAASADTSQRLRRLLLGYLRNQKMRPRLEQGVPVTTEGLQLRFHYSY